MQATGARILVRAGAVAAAVAYAWLALAHGSVGSITAANVPLGFGIGLTFAALTNLVVHAVSEQRTAVFAATIAVSRATGAALGIQVAAAVVMGAGVVPPGFPAERGFTGAFVLGLIAAVVALAATAAIPIGGAIYCGRTPGARAAPSDPAPARRRVRSR